MKDTLHLIARNAAKKFATLETPVDQVATACQTKWTTRPRSTFLTEHVTCDACKLFIKAHRLSGLWWKAAA